jgi:hypothetical protein
MAGKVIKMVRKTIKMAGKVIKNGGKNDKKWREKFDNYFLEKRQFVISF